MKRQVMYFLGIIGLAILLCSVLTYNSFSNRMVKSESGAYFSAEESKTGLEILKTYKHGEAKWVEDQISAELLSLNSYFDVLRIEKRGFREFGMPVYTEEEKRSLHAMYSMNLEQTENRIRLLNYLDYIAKYCATYGEYNAYIRHQAGVLMNISVFSDVKQESFRKTGRDFYLREDIQPVPIVTLGINLFLNCNYSGYIIILTAIFCAWILIYPIQKREDLVFHKSTDFRLSGILFIGFAAVSLAQYQVIKFLWGMDSLSVPIQSIPGFRTCRYHISIGILLMLQTFMKCVGGLIVFKLSEAVLCMQKRWYWGIAAGAAVVLIDRLTLHNWLFRSFFQCDRIIGIYHNITFLKFVFSEEVIWLVIVLAIFAAAVLVSDRQMRKLVLQLKEKNEQKYFEEINDRYNEIRTLRHDINNHLSAVTYLLEEDRIDEAKSYLKGIGSELQDTRLPEKTGIDALDMILWRKLSQAKDKNIILQLDIQESLRNTGLSDYEMCSLFGNMIDNAVEAVSKLETSRKIQLKIVRQMDMICIFCENPYLAITKENGKFVTSKTDFRNHGLGIRQMEHIAKKHGGTVHISTENHLFTISVLLQISKT